MNVWRILLLSLVAVSAASAAPRRVTPPPPFDRNCLEATSWERVQTCIDTYEKGARVSELSPVVKGVSMADARQYLFVRFGERWRMVYRPGDANYELAQTGSMKLHEQAALRIDLSHHVQLGNDGVFIERVTLVCRDATSGCQAVVTACTVITRGRAVETFRGALTVTDGGVTVVGDRSHSGTYCLGR